MDDGIAWIAREDITSPGHYVILARGMAPEELVNRLAGEADPQPLGDYTHSDLDDYLDQLDTENGNRFQTVGVRYGICGDLAFALAEGYWPGEVGPGFTHDLSRNNDHVFQLYHESDNPKLPPPKFSYLHNGNSVCSFDMHMEWPEVSGAHPELVQDDILAAGIHDEEDEDIAHAKSLAIVERRFQLTLPKEQVLHGTLPAALIKGQASM